MKKFKIKIAEFPNHPKGYGTTKYPSEEQVFNKLIEVFPDSYRYIKHFMSDEWQEDSTLPQYNPKVHNYVPPMPDNLCHNVPCGTLHVYANVIGEKR